MVRQTRGTALLAAVLGTLAVGCVGDLCEYAPQVCGDQVGGAGGGAGPAGGGPSGGNGGEGGEGGAPPPGCLPEDNETIEAECGVFVAAGGDGDGSRSDPYGSVIQAVANIGDFSRIYVCGDGMFTGSLVVPPGVSIYGSLDCAGWVYKPNNPRPTILGDENVPAVRIEGTGKTTLQAIQIVGADAVSFDATSLQGNSSIGLWVSETEMTLEDVSIFSGAGAAGGPGQNEGGQAGGGIPGNPGFGCGAPAGGAETSQMCNGMETTGGAGGIGQTMGGVDGANGFPNHGGPNPNGSGGEGDDGGGLPTDWSCSADLGNGEGGEDAPPAMAGSAGTEVGTLAAGFYLGDDGGAGDDGEPGQGGGGGGGRRGNGGNGCSGGMAGPSGGSGGTGGCGGLGGGGGGAGGASVGIVSLDALWTFAGVSITAGFGGAGGPGGNSQLGGNGAGGGGPGGGNACSGGSGGAGANGGAGGGGRGGHSLGVAFTKTDPGLADGAISFAATAASGGTGGNGNAQGNSGSPGLRAPSQLFP